MDMRNMGMTRLETQRKGRLVWEETPFLTHPGAGSGWVVITTHQLRGFSKAEKKRRRDHAWPRLLPHKRPRVAQPTSPDTQTPGEQIYSLGSKGGATAGLRQKGLRVVQWSCRAITSFFHRPHFPCDLHRLDEKGRL